MADHDDHNIAAKKACTLAYGGTYDFLCNLVEVILDINHFSPLIVLL